MSKLIFDKKDYVEDDEWTTGRLKDEFFLDLVKSENCYYQQAKDILYKIPLTEQNPKTELEGLPFVINFKDLSTRVQNEFLEYCKLYPTGNVTLLLKEVVVRLFENLDFNYAHMSVMKKLRVKVEH